MWYIYKDAYLFGFFFFDWLLFALELWLVEKPEEFRMKEEKENRT
jgi:hypothetical protein